MGRSLVLRQMTAFNEHPDAVQWIGAALAYRYVRAVFVPKDYKGHEAALRGPIAYELYELAHASSFPRTRSNQVASAMFRAPPKWGHPPPTKRGGERWGGGPPRAKPARCSSCSTG